MNDSKLNEAALLLKNSRYAIAFTGAGISVESGIPPFRGEDGLWNKYNPIVLDINFFKKNTLESWKVIRELFYDFFGKAKPNKAHTVLAELENSGIIKSIITQNIDNLHQEAGSKIVYEFHGTANKIRCMQCESLYNSAEVDMKKLPPKCKKCGGILKPDFIFFGEAIPEYANRKSFEEAEKCDVLLVIGTTGEVMPASMIPQIARDNGAKIIEINPEKSHFTNRLTSVYLEGKAGIVMEELSRIISEL
ncbi:MAG: NAD-dependent deacylase [Bacteroidales bacterium]